jgi:hypothetical protein
MLNKKKTIKKKRMKRAAMREILNASTEQGSVAKKSTIQRYLFIIALP